MKIGKKLENTLINLKKIIMLFSLKITDKIHVGMFRIPSFDGICIGHIVSVAPLMRLPGVPLMSYGRVKNKFQT